MNRKNYLWNPVFSRIMEIKDKFIKKNGDIGYLKARRTVSSHNGKNFNDNILTFMANDLNIYKDWINTVNIRPDSTGGRVLLHYDQINSGDMHSNPNSINREARSIYIDVDNEAIILCPFRKFFNAEEVPENNIELLRKEAKNASIVEISDKMDGSNQNAAYYNGEVILCGSKSVDPENSFQLKLGKEMIENDENYIRMLKDNPNITFMFEFIHPEDAHVVDYTNKEKGLYLIAYRNNLTGETSTYSDAIKLAEKYNVKHIEIETYDFDGLLKARKEFKGAEKEGWVLNINGHRVKMKTDDYLLAFKLCTGTINLSNLIIKNIADGTYDDFISSFPDDKDVKPKVIEQAEKIQKYVESETNILNNLYRVIISGLPKDATQKDYALLVQKEAPTRYHKFLYMLKQGKELNVLKTGNSYIDIEDIGLDTLRGKNARINLKDEMLSENDDYDIEIE